MVAACATASSAASAATRCCQTGFIIGQKHMATATSGATEQKQLVATMAAVMVEQLRQQLQLVVDNGDLTASITYIGQLENAILNKETLEATRIGRFINDIRKQTAQQWPDFSKRCRALIKQWQKIAEYRPSSSCEGSSNGGTPQLVSPALRRGLTPRTQQTTPGKRSTPQPQRVTSTGLHPPDARHTGPPLENGVVASGSYAPLPPSSTAFSRKKISPQMAAVVMQHQQPMHKSASVGATMCHLEEQQPTMLFNGIAASAAGGPISSAVTTAAVAVAQQQNPPLMLKLKRSASGVQRLTTESTSPVAANNGNGLSPPQPPQSVHAARKDVQSTAMLVAQLNETLPQHIGIDLSTTPANKQQQQHIESVTTTAQHVVTKVSPDLPASTSTAAAVQDVKGTKRRYQTRRGGKASSEEREEAAFKLGKIGEEASPLTAQAAEDAKKSDDKAEVSVKKEGEQQPEERKKKIEQSLLPPQEVKAKTKKGKGRKKKDDQQQQQPGTSATAAKFNWFAEYPLDDAEVAPSGIEIPARVLASPTRSFVLPVQERQVLLLPYVDIGLPDWKTHHFPQSERFIFPELNEEPPFVPKSTHQPHKPY